MTRVRDQSVQQPSRASRGSKGATSDPSVGLVILHGEAEDTGGGVKCDIITIHGLTGHYMKTWTTESDVCWPQDLLPKMTSRLGVNRIMTFGYAAGQHGTKVDLDVEDAAWKLIHGLERIRTTTEALIISNNALSLRHLLWSVEGVVFLATPHRGSAMADVADKIIRFTNVSGTPQKFVKTLKQRSPELFSVAEEFRQIVNQRRLPVASFYELHSFKAIPCMNFIVVTKDSAVLHIPSEKLYGAERNHRNIAHFEDVYDEVFQQVVDSIEFFMKKGTVSSNARVFIPWDCSSHFKGRRDVLQQLHETFFPQQDNPKAALSYASGRRLAMIHGDGGLGKTEVTLKYARENEFRYSYIFFIEATSIETMKTEIAQVHENLGLPKDSGRELHDLRAFLREEQSWLLILDNDNDFLALNYLKLPEVAHGHILMTCRSRENTTDPRVSKVIHLPPLEKQAARDLLFSRAGISLAERAKMEDGATSLIDTLGYIPAMVENTAAYMVSFQADMQTCLKLMRHRKSRRGIMGYHAASSRYKLSAESLFRIRLDSLKTQQPNAYLLLSSATEKRRRWAVNGEPEYRPARSTFVPQELIDLVSGPEFSVAMNNLKSSSLIARDEVFDRSAGSKDSIVLHPSLYQFLRDVTSQDDAAKALSPALTMIAHAHPILEAGLEKSIPLKRQMTYQVHQCLRNIQELGTNTADLLKAFQSFWGLRYSEFCEAMAEVLLEAVGNYGDNDEMDKRLITLVESMLRDSNSVYLHARLWSKRLPLEYYKPGNLYGGCAAADKFLESLDTRNDRQGWTNRDNAEVGILRALTVEYRPQEPGLSPRQTWEKRAEYIDTWQPLDVASPSSLERYVVGLGVRMRGKLAKDFGQYKEAYFDLKEYCEGYSERGSREEGWAIGDFGLLVVELEKAALADGNKKTDEILADLASHGISFGGEKVSLAEGARACDISAYVLSRAIDSRMFERGYLTPEARRNVKDSDIVWLEIIHAMTLVHQGEHAPQRFEAAEKELTILSSRFKAIEAAGSSWYDEQIRHFAIKCSLAQVSHLQGDWPEAQLRWTEAIDFGVERVKDWKGQHYYIEVARYSLADAQCNAGIDARVVLTPLIDTIKILKGKRVTWLLGLGTFWLDLMEEYLKPQNEAASTLGGEDSVEDKMTAMSVIIRDL
ncbi:P-loop containing nucleoside triphosphate hydrolase protein [Apiospora kogelbergensis]|uniref:P-loop containing nucleoside triphosphate hydrolase protein n=1 Tax=Apiospora kogelbergensis TaxID=1337665 RepID=UPI00312E7917